MTFWNDYTAKVTSVSWHGLEMRSKFCNKHQVGVQWVCGWGSAVLLHVTAKTAKPTVQYHVHRRDAHYKLFNKHHYFLLFTFKILSSTVYRHVFRKILKFKYISSGRATSPCYSPKYRKHNQGITTRAARSSKTLVTSYQTTKYLIPKCRQLNKLKVH